MTVILVTNLLIYKHHLFLGTTKSRKSHYSCKFRLTILVLINVIFQFPFLLLLAFLPVFFQLVLLKI